MSATTAAILEILEGVDALDADQPAKAAFRRLIRAIGTAHGIAAVEKAGQIEFARHLLCSKVSRATVRDRLIAHFGVSRPQAYRIMSTALQLSQDRAIFETRSESNQSID